MADQAGVACTISPDCPHFSDHFCTGDVCIGGYCRPKPSPCVNQCNEEFRLCVECNTAADCSVETSQQVCDAKTHTCRACESNQDCPEGPFCYGGNWICVKGGCVAPTPNLWPCDGQLELCVEEGNYCRECLRDSDCGAWDYCTNPRKCDTTSGLCVRDTSVRNCVQEGLQCDSANRRCVQCTQDLHCQQTAVSFCQPKATCNISAGSCYWNGKASCPSPSPSDGRLATCNEERASCLPRQCLTTGLDEDCDDGNACNGVEICRNTICYAASEGKNKCPDGLSCDPQNPGHCSDATLRMLLQQQENSMACNSLADCAPLGLICKIVIASGSIESDGGGYAKLCVRCKNHNQCQDGDASNGQEVCNSESGRCEAGVSPCASAPPGMQFNPVTQKCDRNVLTLDTGAMVVTSQNAAAAAVAGTRASGVITNNIVINETSPLSSPELRNALMDPHLAVVVVTPIVLVLLVILLCYLGGFRVYRAVPSSKATQDDTEEEEEERPISSSSESRKRKVVVSANSTDHLQHW